MRFIVLIMLLVFAVPGCGPADPGQVSVTELASPAGQGSQAPNLARAPDGHVYLSWIEPAGPESRLAFSKLGKLGWSPAGTIAQGENWFVNWADFPSLLPLGDGRMAAHWLVRSGPGTYAYDVRVGLSMDEGRHWQSLGTIHDDGTQTEHGFVAMYAYRAEDEKLWPGLVWLDGRKMTGGHGGHDGPATPSGMTLRHARIRPDGSRTQELELDGLACDCCQTAAVNAGTEVLVAYRDRSEEEVRDIRLLRRGASGWQDQGYVFSDGWRIEACPVNGPAMDAMGERVAIAWFTAADDRLVVKAGMSKDAGRTFEFYELEEGDVLGRVDVALTEAGAAISWLAGGGDGARIRLQLFGPDGAPSGSPVTIIDSDASRGSGFPRLISAGNAFLLAWTDVKNGPSRVRTARIRMQR